MQYCARLTRETEGNICSVSYDTQIGVTWATALCSCLPAKLPFPLARGVTNKDNTAENSVSKEKTIRGSFSHGKRRNELEKHEEGDGYE